MPVTPEAQRIPVLKNFIQNPTIQTAAKYLQWQAKYFKQIYKIGDSIPAAITQFGTKAYPLNYKSVTYTDLNGFDTQKKATVKYLNDLLKKYNIKFLLFFGKNRDLDITSVFGLKNIFEKYSNFNATIVFRTLKDKDIFDSLISVLPKGKAIKSKFKEIVDEKAFEKLDIFTTPSLVIVQNNQAQILLRGKLQLGFFTQKLYNYFEMKNMLNHSELSDYKTWNDNTNYRQKFYSTIYGVDINKILNKENNISKKGESDENQ